MRRGWADKWAAGNAAESQSEPSTRSSTATGAPRITLPIKDALDPSNPRCKDLQGTVTVEFRNQVYATGHCYVSSHIVACDGIPEDQILAEDIMFQVENDGEPMFGLLSQNFPDAANGPRVGTNEIVFNPAKAFPCNLQLLIDKGLVQDTGRRVDQGYYRDLPVVSVLF
ncbi:g7172 [Coccomyxa elongata]